MYFDGVTALETERERQAREIKDLMGNIYENLSTKYCEYVDNINNIYCNTQNHLKAVNYNGCKSDNNFTDIFQKAYNNIINTSIFSDKTKGLSGYVENFVDNSEKNNELYKVIHNKYNYAENLSHENQNISEEYKSFAEYVKNAESSDINKSLGININMGGITQNISDGNCDDVLDMLTDKLREALASCGSGIYY